MNFIKLNKWEDIKKQLHFKSSRDSSWQCHLMVTSIIYLEDIYDLVRTSLDSLISIRNLRDHFGIELQLNSYDN